MPRLFPCTVFDVDHDEERAAAQGMEVNGFSFEGMDAPGMDYALNRCLVCLGGGATVYGVLHAVLWIAGRGLMPGRCQLVAGRRWMRSSKRASGHCCCSTAAQLSACLHTYNARCTAPTATAGRSRAGSASARSGTSCASA